MADKRISQLNSHTSPSGSDLLVIVNNNETKKITYDALKDSIVFNSDNTLLNDFSASYIVDSASFDERITQATNEQDLSRYAVTSSNDFTGYQTALGFTADTLTANSVANLRSISGIADTTITIVSPVELSEGITGSIGATNGVISGSQQITDLGFISISVDIADFTFTSENISNNNITLDATNNITLHTQNGNIILNPDGNAYIGSANAGNGIVTDGYLSGIIGDTNTVNNSTGHTLTDNLTNIINSIPSISNLATTGSNTFNGDETISGSLFISGTTELGGNIVPKTSRGATLGTQDRPFKDIFIQSASIHIQSDIPGVVDTTLSNVSGNILISAGGMQLVGTGSFNAATASFSYVSGGVYYTDLESTLNQFSSSLDTRIKAATNEQSFNGLISGSSQLTSSYDTRYVLSGSITQTTWDNIANKPSGIVSSSVQVLGGSGVTSGSYETTGRGIISSSLQTTNWGYTTTSSFNTFTQSYQTDSSSFDARITANSGSATIISDTIYNGETTTLVKGTPVYVSGSQGANPIVYRADASNPTKMPVTYIVGTNISTHATGNGLLLGQIDGMDLTGYIPGQQVYVAEGGGWTINPPSGSSSIKQFLGLIVKEGNGGKGMILNPGPATLPNLQSGYIWVGDGNNQATTISSASFATTSSLNTFTASYSTDSASFDIRISSLVSAGVPAGTVSGSSQLTSSYDTRYTLSGSVQPLPSNLVSSSAQIEGFETTGRNIISSSAQISAYGFISSSHTDITSLNAFTASYFTDSASVDSHLITIDTKLSSLISNTGSYETTGRGIISQSVVTISDTQPSTGVGNLWYDSNNGNMYLHYDTNTWVDTSNGVIQSIISDGTLLTTASFNAWTSSYTASVPAGTISGSGQITSFGFVSGSYETTGRGIISSSAQLTSLGYVISGGNATFNSVTANQYIVSSSVYYVTESYASGSHIFGNSLDDTHQFTGSVSISGSLNISPSASLGAKLWQLQDVNDTASGSITNGYQLAWNSSTSLWEPTAGATAKGSIRLYMATQRSNGTAFYFNANTRTASDSASPSSDTAFMVTTALLNKVTVYLRQDGAGPNSTQIAIYKNANGSAFSTAGIIASASLSLTTDTIQTYTFTGLTLNQFDSLHVYCDPTSTPGTLYSIVTVE
jgi:hypothetical protein